MHAQSVSIHSIPNFDSLLASNMNSNSIISINTSFLEEHNLLHHFEDKWIHYFVGWLQEYSTEGLEILLEYLAFDLLMYHLHFSCIVVLED